MTSDKNSNEAEFDIFIANSTYPDAGAVFANIPPKLASVKDTSIIVLDTNALFVPYSIGKDSLEQIKKTYKALTAQKRLMIPGQVAREFAKNRAGKLIELFQRLSQKRNSIQDLQMGKYPLLEANANYQSAVKLEDAINKQIQDYRKAIGKVLQGIQEWNWDDPVSLLYNETFVTECVFDPQFDKEKISSELETRYQHSIPPGYKDANKDDSGVGDFLIWKTILEIGKVRKSGIIFVTGDEKFDWRHKIDKQVLYPRYELVDEFRRETNGFPFHLIQFSEFLGLFGASDNVVEEVRQKEQLALLDATKASVPSGLEQIIEVCLEVFQKNLDYMDAVRSVAETRGLWWTTVADKCTRRIGLDAAQFRSLLQQRNKLVLHLVEQYPDYEDYIRKILTEETKF